MKQIKCELCGSNSLVKQGDMFICQGCGTQYSVEDAKKMMVEVEDQTADVVSKVKVDQSDELKNLYLLARRARDEDNTENARKYYDQIIVKNPNDWEAAFYLVYYKAMGCKIAEIASAGYSVVNTIETTVTLIKENVEGREEQINALKEVALRCELIAAMLYRGAQSHYNGIDASIKDRYTQEMINNCASAYTINYTLGNVLDSVFGEYDEVHSLSVSAWKDGITFHKGIIKYFQQFETNKNIILGYADKIKKYDASYVAPNIEKPAPAGCYVATAVYGSYDCPQVWTLRRFRDNTLAETWYGRAFIRTYYAISPTLVKWFGDTEWFKNMWRGKLDRMVENLQAQGVEDTPYEDRQW